MGVLLELYGTRAYNHCQELHAFKSPKASTESIIWQSILMLNAHDLQKTPQNTKNKKANKTKNPQQTKQNQNKQIKTRPIKMQFLFYSQLKLLMISESAGQTYHHLHMVWIKLVNSFCDDMSPQKSTGPLSAELTNVSCFLEKRQTAYIMYAWRDSVRRDLILHRGEFCSFGWTKTDLLLLSLSNCLKRKVQFPGIWAKVWELKGLCYVSASTPAYLNSLCKFLFLRVLYSAN